MTWTHQICERCWIEREFDVEEGVMRKPVMVKSEHMTLERCCFCSELTFLGIFVRHDPNLLRCTHDDDAPVFAPVHPDETMGCLPSLGHPGWDRLAADVITPSMGGSRMDRPLLPAEEDR